MRRSISRLLALILLAGVLLPILPVTADAAGESSRIALSQPGSGELEPFFADNLFPGDSVTREYAVTTRHDKPITLHYHADIRPDADYRKLAEVLMVRIQAQGTLLYDGLMAAMPAALSWDLPAGTNTVTYRITAYLETSVGNPYMNQQLLADFRWWFLDDADVAVVLTAEKLMDGQYARGSDFSFVLKDDTGKVVSTVKNDDGHVEFPPLHFDTPDTYTYTMEEVKGTNSRVTYDTAVYQALITVNPDGSYAIAYTRNGAEHTTLPRFLNAAAGTSGSDNPSDYNPSNPKTGDDFPLMLVSILCGSSLCLLICLLLLWKNPKKEDEAHG